MYKFMYCTNLCTIKHLKCSYKDILKKYNNNFMLPKLKTYSTQNFLNNYKNIINNNDSDDFVVISVYDKNDNINALSYNGDEIIYYEFFIDIKSLNLYKDCEKLTKFIDKYKNKKFIVISHDGFYLAQSVARYISEFWLTQNEQESFMKLNFDIFADNFDLSYWLRRSKFKLKVSDEEIFLNNAINKYLITFKEQTLKQIS